MTDFTQHWHWPQWVFLIGLLARAIYHVSHGGRVIVYTDSDRKGEPMRYNAGMAILQTGIWLAVLIAGGFFA